MAAAPKLLLDLEGVSSSGYFTVETSKKNQDNTNAGYKTTSASLASGSEKIATVSVGDTTSVLKGLSNAVSVGGTSTATWRITTGSNADIIDASNLGSDTTILAGAGDNSITGGVGTFITTGGGADSIVAGKENYIVSGSGDDTIEIGEGATYVTVNAGAGKDSISIGGKGAQVTLGNGDGTKTHYNEVLISEKGTDAVVVGGSGADSIQVGGKGATLTLGNGKDIVSVGANTTITDYKLSDDVIQIAETADPSKADKIVDHVSGKYFGTDGSLKLDANTTLTVNATNGYYGIGYETGTTAATTNVIYWAGESASTIAATTVGSATSAVIVSANNSDVGDRVTGTSGKDTIIAGSNDTIVAGAGSDSIYFVDNSENATVELATVSAESTATVTGGTNGVVYGFDDTNLTLAINGKISAAKFSEADNGLTVTVGKAAVSLGGAAADNHLYSANEGALLKVKDSTGTTYNVEAIAAAKTATLASDATYIYGGEGAALALSDSVNGSSVTIDLRNDSTQFGDTRTYSGITSVTADGYTGDAKLVGSATTANSLVGGAEGGHVSLYGGGSKADTLVGGDSQDIFFYGKGDGRDVIENYTYDDDDTKTDKLAFWTGDLPTTIKRTSDTSVELTIGSGTSNRLTVNTTSSDVDTAIAYQVNGTDYKVKVANYDKASTLTYDSTVGFYQGGKGTDTLAVNSDSNVVVALDGSQSGYNYTSIEAVDASNSTGAVTLRGGSASETFTGSINGNTTFEFGLGGGHDTITATSATDRIYLYDVEGLNGGITSYGVTDGTLEVKLSDGSRLTVNNFTDGTVFATSDNTTGWVYDSSSGSWSLAQ
jgi:hypothetical protein